MNVAIEKPTTECAACGGPIVTPFGRWKEFCSDECYRTGRTFCKGCGEPNPPSKYHNREFCSNACRYRYKHRGAYNLSSYLEERNCKACGKPLPQTTNRTTRQFCNPTCRWRFNRAKQRGQDLLQEWGSFAPETRKSLREVQQLIGIGAANRLAAAIGREYYMRRPNHPKDAFTAYHCKACGKEFRRRSQGHKSKDYCSPKCDPSSVAQARRSLVVSRPGEASINAKLTWEKVDEIREICTTSTITYEALGEKYGVSGTVIRKVVHYESWKPENDPRRIGRT